MNHPQPSPTEPRPHTAEGGGDRRLLEADPARSLDRRNLTKPVLAARVLDDFESIDGWRASDVVALSSTAEHSRSRSRSLRFSTLLRNPEYIAASRTDNGSFAGQAVLFEAQPFAAVIGRKFDPPQDWTEFNRISLWCYVHPTDTTALALSLQFLCDGASAGPQDPIAIHYFGDLRPGEWNHLAWEIPEYRRDSVSEIVLFQPTFGVTGAEPRVTYDIDAIELQRVDAETVEGWSVRPGTIAYSHLGYQPSAQKIAVSDVAAATEFELIGSDGSVAVRLPVRIERNDRGAWAILDFSTYDRTGEWRIRYGDVTSASFPISEDCWLPLIEATLNAFFGLRCGFPVPGVHAACHMDVFTEHRGDRRPVGGGWHDAANLTQGPGRTHLSVFALCELADSLARAGRTELATRAAEEARWGAEWSITTRFEPGIRVLYDDVSYYTDGVVGTDDDVLQEGRGGAGYDEFQNILGVLAMARAARTFTELDADFADRLRAGAEEDFAIAIERSAPPADAPPVHINQSAWRDRVGYLCLAAVELFRVTGDPEHRAAAVRLGRFVLDQQERRFVDGVSIAGYFYEDPGRTRIVHEYHDGFEDSGLLALAALDAEFPDEADWIEWRAALSIYGDYFCHRGSAAAAPFGLLPAAVWRRADLDAPAPPDPVVTGMAFRPTPLFPTPPTPDVVRDQMLRMFEDGADLGADHRLRRFPLWYDHVRHGSTTVHLGKTIGLTAVATARSSSADAALATRQLEWVVGANPFSRSLVYGVGYDWWQNFSVELPNLVGGLSLGFNSYSGDAPAWGNNAVFPYKEMWVYASSRLAMLLSRVGSPTRVTSTAAQGASLRHGVTGSITTLPPGSADVTLPSGSYEVEFGAANRWIHLLDGQTVRLDLDPDHWIEIDLDVVQSTGDEVSVGIKATGKGTHTVPLLWFNAASEQRQVEFDLEPDAPAGVECVARIVDLAVPWLLVASPTPDATVQIGGPDVDAAGPR